MSDIYKRWRHTRGFGVHSPYAFGLITEVVRQTRGYAYYGYESLTRDFGGSVPRAIIRKARLLLRLAARCDVGAAFLPDTPEARPFAAALRLADSRMTLTAVPELADNARLICVSADGLPLERLIELLERPGRIIALRDAPEGWREKLFETLDEGLMFYGRKNLIIFNRPGMRKVCYSIMI